MPRTTHTFTAKKLTPVMSAKEATEVAIKLPASVSYPAGQVLGQLTADVATNKYTRYVTGASDGSETARLLLVYDVSTDSSGNHYFGTTAASEHDQTFSTVPAYRNGTFKTADLTDLDAAAVVDFGRLIQGNVANGILQLI